MLNPNGRPSIAPRAFALATTVALVALVSPAAPPAAAHCDSGTESYLLGIASTCPYNDQAEVVIDALNAASDDSMVYVLVKDLRFHPEVVDVVSGGTVVFVYADSDNPQNHDPKSSGSTGSAAADLVKPTPPAPGTCFSVTSPNDNGAQMTSLGEVYPLTFTFDGDELHKSRGFQTGQPLGDLTGAQPWRSCPTDSFSVAGDGTGVLPYHCGVHGAATTAEKDMRAAIRLLPA